MQRISSITFRLCFGALLLGIPVSYSAVENYHYTRLHYAAQHHKKLNAHNRAYSCYIEYIVYTAAMQTYKAANSRSTPVIDIDDRPIVPKDALARLKKEMRMSPKICLLVTSGYLRENFVEDDTKDFSNMLTFLVSGFLQHGYYYQLTKKRILYWAVIDRKWGFITEWLADEQRLCHLYTGDKDVEIQIGKVKQYYGNIYTHKNNFLKTKLLLWLTESHHWPVSTDKQIREGDMDIYLWHYFTKKQRKLVAYKMKVIQLLQDEKGFFARLFRFHLLNAECLDRGQSSTALMKLRDSFFEGRPLQKKLLCLLSTLYWIGIDMPSVLDTTGSFCLDIFCAPVLLAFTFPGLLIIVSLVNCCLVYYLFYMLDSLNEATLAPSSAAQKIDKVYTKFPVFTPEKILILLTVEAMEFALLDQWLTTI